MFSWCHLSIHFFFFFKQKTAYDMRISDWSSDVCSSDLSAIRKFRAEPRRRLSRYEDQERRDRRPRHPAGQPPAERAEMDREWRRAVRHRTGLARPAEAARRVFAQKLRLLHRRKRPVPHAATLYPLQTTATF